MLFEIGRAAVGCDVVEDFGHVAPDDGIGGEIGQIGVNFRGGGVIIAGADMAIGPKLAILLADDLAEFRVRFHVELGQAVDDMHAGLFELLGPFEVGQFIETRHHFDHHGHAFAGLASLPQRLHDGRFFRCPVERPLDRDHIRIGRGLPQILQNDIEGFIGVMDDDVLCGYRREAIVVVLGDAFGEADFEGLVEKIGAVAHDDLGNIGDREEPVQRSRHRPGRSPILRVISSFAALGREELISSRMTSPSWRCTSA